MNVKTRDFGIVDAAEADMITFEQPIFGFEQLRRFVVLMDDTLDGEFIWLQSVENPSVCFVLASPEKTVPGYAPTIPEEVRTALGAGTYELWLVMVVTSDFRCSTVNLKSPVVLNISNNTGMQTILEDELPIRFPLFRNGEEEKVC